MLCSASILTVIVHSAIWSLVEMERWLAQHCMVAVELFIRTVRYSYTEQFLTTA